MCASRAVAAAGVGEGSAAFTDVAQVTARLEATGYLTDPTSATVVFLAQQLDKPILVEGPAGVGKTELAKALAQARGARLLRLQCYEGLDESRALFEWNYKKQLLRIQHASGLAATGGPGAAAAWEEVQEDLFTEEYLLERPLLQALRSPVDTVLLIDEVDKVDVEFEALLLEILAEFQVTIPELGTVRGMRRPIIVLTSNATRELSEALRRRCLYLRLEHPSLERERAIVAARIPEAPAVLTDQVVRIVRSLRTLDLRKPPSISETLDWVRTLLALGHETVDTAALALTANVLLKHQRDIDLARAHLAGAAGHGGGRA
jgi:MoxR-like ATPase